MNAMLERLKREHRRLDRIVETCRHALRHEELKLFKTKRLMLKDKIAILHGQMGRDPPA